MVSLDFVVFFFFFFHWHATYTLPFHIGNVYVVSLNDTRAIYVIVECDTLNYEVSNLKRYQKHAHKKCSCVSVCGGVRKFGRRNEKFSTKFRYGQKQPILNRTLLVHSILSTSFMKFFLLFWNDFRNFLFCSFMHTCMPACIANAHTLKMMTNTRDSLFVRMKKKSILQAR